MKTKVDVLVTVEVTHEEDASKDFINNLALEAVSKNCVRGCNNNFGLYSAIAVSKEVIDLDQLKEKAKNEFISASIKATNDYLREMYGKETNS